MKNYKTIIEEAKQPVLGLELIGVGFVEKLVSSVVL